MTRESYNDVIKNNYEKKIELIVGEMPFFVQFYFDVKMEKMSYKTLLGYAYDLQKFLSWYKNDSYPSYKNICELTAADFSMVTAHDIERYTLFLQQDANKPNSAVSVRRKISSLSSVYNFLCDHFYVDENPCREVEYPDIVVPDKDVLTVEEINNLLNLIRNESSSPSKRQNAYLNKNKERDFVIITLLLLTGIRINECVELDINSINFDKKTLRVSRGSDIFLPLSDTMLEILKKYKENRIKIDTKDKALFLSLQNKRMCTQAIEDMIKKYGKQAKTSHTLTPKIFRHTFAAELYAKTANADLINSYLGKRKIEEIKILMNHLSKDNRESICNALNSLFQTVDFAFSASKN